MTTTPNPGVSGRGVALSYIRFLSDSATGYTVLLLLGLAAATETPVLGVAIPALRSCPPIDAEGAASTFGCLSAETLVGLYLLAFLLATPLGLTLNAASWFLVGWLEKWAVGFSWGKRTSFPFAMTNHSFNVDRWQEMLKLERSDAWATAENLENLLMVFFPAFLACYEHVNGIRLLTRNLGLIFTVAAVVALCGGECVGAAVFAVAAGSSLSLNAMIAFHYSCAILNGACLICLANNPYLGSHLERECGAESRLRLIERTLLATARGDDR